MNMHELCNVLLSLTKDEKKNLLIYLKTQIQE